MTNRILKSMIDEKVLAMKQDLDKIINDDLSWIEMICINDDFDILEYQDYYIEQLDKYYEIKINGNKRN